MIGADNTWVLDRLSGYGVDVAHVGKAEAATGHAIIMVDEMGENSIVTFAGANYAQLVGNIEAALAEAQPGDILALQTEVSHLAEAAQFARARGMFVVYSAAPFKPEIAKKMLPHVDLLALNEIEAGQLAQALGIPVEEVPVPNMLITLGGRGARWRDQATGEVTEVAAFPVEQVDTTGAGDCFIGYVLAGLDQGLERATALRLGAAAAALKVTRPGTADAIPARAEVDALLAETETEIGLDLAHERDLVFDISACAPEPEPFVEPDVAVGRIDHGRAELVKAPGAGLRDACGDRRCAVALALLVSCDHQSPHVHGFGIFTLFELGPNRMGKREQAHGRVTVPEPPDIGTFLVGILRDGHRIRCDEVLLIGADRQLQEG